MGFSALANQSRARAEGYYQRAVEYYFDDFSGEEEGRDDGGPLCR